MLLQRQLRSDNIVSMPIVRLRYYPARLVWLCLEPTSSTCVLLVLSRRHRFAHHTRKSAMLRGRRWRAKATSLDRQLVCSWLSSLYACWLMSCFASTSDQTIRIHKMTGFSYVWWNLNSGWCCRIDVTSPQRTVVGLPTGWVNPNVSSIIFNQVVVGCRRDLLHLIVCRHWIGSAVHIPVLKL